MDIALILSRIRPNAAWRDASTYERLVATWEDNTQTCPTEAELEAEWIVIQNELVVKYCYYDYGVKSKTVDGNYVAGTGEVLFSSTPTELKLESAFPSTAGSITHIVTANGVSTDTVTVQDETLTAGTDFEFGTDLATTATNIATALNAKTNFALYFTAAASDATITVTEKIPGNKLTPSAATTTGTIAIISGTPIPSVYGYKNGIMSQNLRSLTGSYVSKLVGVKRGLLDAYSYEATATVTKLKVLRQNVVTEYKGKGEVIING